MVSMERPSLRGVEEKDIREEGEEVDGRDAGERREVQEREVIRVDLGGRVDNRWANRSIFSKASKGEGGPK
jgi:hypothetical protein